ncbi:MAG: MmgE/PrpD family protein [Thermodesulfobacteriota bacterium]|nr:MmgE/PrpD family protein [Thermodesulfobacteriota bacterium]
METWLHRLGHLIEETRYESLPPLSIERAKMCLLDTLGVMSHGSLTESSQAIYSWAKDQRVGGRSTVVGGGFKTSPLIAALCNGTSGHSVEMDDFHKGSVLHPGVVVVPAVLAVGEEVGTSGRDSLLAFVLGYETMIRIGMASLGTQHQLGFHPTGTCGIFGSAAAASRLYGLKEEKIVHALGISGTQASGLLEYKTSGDWTKRLQAGMASSRGILCAQLASYGFTGPSTILEGPYGFLKVFCAKYDVDLIGQKLGEKWMIEGISFKPYASCRFSHAPIDAFLHILNEEDLEADEIEWVKVEVSEQAIRSIMYPEERKYRPETVVDAQFSLPYCLAVAGLFRKVTPREFEAERLKDERILSFARKVGAFAVETYTKRYPRHIGCGVTLRARGKTFSHEVIDSKGDPEVPFSYEELEQKFKKLTDGILEISLQEKLIGKVRRFEDLISIGEIFEKENG